MEADRSTSGPILVISASGTTAEGTPGVLHAALDKFPAALKDMQDELAIADKLRINVRTVMVDGQATKNNESQMRLMLLAAGAGTVGTVLLTAMMDNFLSGRKGHGTPTVRSGQCREKRTLRARMAASLRAMLSERTLSGRCRSATPCDKRSWAGTGASSE